MNLNRQSLQAVGYGSRRLIHPDSHGIGLFLEGSAASCASFIGALGVHVGHAECYPCIALLGYAALKSLWLCCYLATLLSWLLA